MFSPGIATSDSWSQVCPVHVSLRSIVFRWPKAFESTVSSSSVVLLDMETFSLACMVGGPQWGLYIMSIAVFPLGAVWLLVCFTFSRQVKQNPKLVEIEGSLEVKLPTIWTDEKQRWEESEKRRE